MACAGHVRQLILFLLAQLSALDHWMQSGNRRVGNKQSPPQYPNEYRYTMYSEVRHS